MKTPNFLPKTSQGFTTEILMPDGISYAPLTPQTWPDWCCYLRGLDGLLIAPSDRSVIRLGKTASVVVYLLLMEVIAVPAFALFYAPVDAAMIGAILLADIGIAAVGTLLSAIALASRTRELLLPLLFLPLAIPVIIGGVGASVADDPGRFLWFLGLYDAIFAIISWASFEYVVTE